MVNSHISSKIKKEITGVFLITAAILLVLCMLNPSVGLVAGFISKSLRTLAGEGRYLFPLAMGVAGVSCLRKSRVSRPVNIHGYLLLLLVGLTLLHFPVPVDFALQAGIKGDGGGIIGGLASFILHKSFGRVGTCLILTALLLVALLVVSNKTAGSILTDGYEKIRTGVQTAGRLLDQVLFTYEEEKEFRQVKKSKKESVDDTVIWDYSGSQDHFGEEAAALDYELSREVTDNEETAEVAYEKEKDTGNREFQAANNTTGDYKLPPCSLLTKPSLPKEGLGGKNINQSLRKLEATLESFGIKVKVNKVVRGPTVTRYEVQPPPGIKVSKIVNLADDIALCMAAQDIRIEAPVPGVPAVGIEVPNKEIAKVYLRELIESQEFTRSPSKLTLALGKDVAGKPVVADLAKMPHLLIAGATGSGKSVCLNTIIASVLFKAAPHEVKFLIIDPKMVELATYNGIGHLVSPVVTDAQKAATALRWAVKEMEHRYELFAEVGVRDIYRYNALVSQKGKRELSLPLIMIIIDELADLMMVAPAEVESSISRLAQMSRAAGMHLVIATQRPSVDVITGLIKANIPSRISFAVSSQIDSRTILDMGGAEKLLGKGDMLFYPVGASKPVRVQGAYLSDRDVDNLVAFLKEQAEPVYDEGFISSEERAIEGQEGDELFPLAVRLVMEAGHASISMLQRRLRIGYARAARLIDEMERKGVVGPFEGSKPRMVLLTWEQYEKKYGSAAGKRTSERNYKEGKTR